MESMTFLMHYLVATYAILAKREPTQLRDDRMKFIRELVTVTGFGDKPFDDIVERIGRDYLNDIYRA